MTCASIGAVGPRVLPLVMLLSLAPGQTPGQTGAPRIIVVEGEGAIHNIREGRAAQPLVLVQDSIGRPLEGVAVTFIGPESGPGVQFANGLSITVRTDARGEARASGMRPNRIPGGFRLRVEAGCGGQIARALIGQTNAAPLDKRRGWGRKAAVAAIVGAAAAAAVAIAAGGN